MTNQTFVTSSTGQYQPQAQVPVSEIKPAEQNANTTAIDSLASNVASQLFLTPSGPSQKLISSELSHVPPPSSLPAFTSAPQTSIQQSFVQSEGNIFKNLSKICNKLKFHFSGIISCPNDSNV